MENDEEVREEVVREEEVKEEEVREEEVRDLVAEFTAVERPNLLNYINNNHRKAGE